MSFGWKRVVLGAVAALALGSAVQASELRLTVQTSEYSGPQQVADYGAGSFERRDYGRSEGWYERRNPDRYYGRPVREWRERHYHSGVYYHYHSGVYYSVPVA